MYTLYRSVASANSVVDSWFSLILNGPFVYALKILFPAAIYDGIFIASSMTGVGRCTSFLPDHAIRTTICVSAFAQQEARAVMGNETVVFPQMPQIGHPEMYYARLARNAERHQDTPAHEAAKVGQYITLALDRHLSWTQKLRYFRHAMDRHCQPPKFSDRFRDDSCWQFYHNLADLVRAHCGAEALRLASAEDDAYAVRVSMGQSREAIAEDAEGFFINLMGDFTQCPVWFSHDDWEQLKLIRDQWI
jgi:hypothetical protein